MFRALSAFMAVSILLWVMPLGAFIQKSEEYRTCGGKRAVHQCSSVQGQIRTGPAQVSFSSPSGVQKAPASGPGVSADIESVVRTGHGPRRLRAETSAPLFTSYLRSPLSPPPRILS